MLLGEFSQIADKCLQKALHNRIHLRDDGLFDSPLIEPEGVRFVLFQEKGL